MIFVKKLINEITTIEAIIIETLIEIQATEIIKRKVLTGGTKYTKPL